MIANLLKDFAGLLLVILILGAAFVMLFVVADFVSGLVVTG